MTNTEVAIIGGGAAGIAAGRRLREAGVDCLIVEARPRLGGRAFTVELAGYALDLGCGWLHSADRNAWSAIAGQVGCTVVKSPAPWERPSLERVFPRAEQLEFFRAQNAFDERVDHYAESSVDQAAAEFLEPGNRWNALIDAVSTYYSGVELERLSGVDLARYRDNGVNWRVHEGYGTAIAAAGATVPAALECAVSRIRHDGKRIRIETAKGTIEADAAIVTLPTSLLADERLFAPVLPDKIAAAIGLPLGLADKLFLSLAGAEEFEADSRLFGHTDRCKTGSYHVRPMGRPLIEAYFGGMLARELEGQGDAAFFDFAAAELSEALGSGFTKRLKPIAVHRWSSDPFAKGSYSYAQPGKADYRANLAAPVDGRLFFAGEACSLDEYSTAHGAYNSGIAAADQVIAARDDA